MRSQKPPAPSEYAAMSTGEADDATLAERAHRTWSEHRTAAKEEGASGHTGPFARVLRRPLGGRKLLKLLLGNIGWYAADKIIRTGLGLVTTTQIARYLSPHGFGVLNYGIAFAALFAPLASMGVQTVVCRDLVRFPSQRANILGSALVVRVSGAIIAATACMIAETLMSGGPDARAVVLAQVAALFPLAWEVIDYDFQAHLQPRPVIIIRCASALVFSAVRLGLVAAGASIAAFAWTAAAEFGMATLLLRAAAARSRGVVRLRDATVARVKSVLRESWPLLITGIAIAMYMRTDQVMLGYMAGVSSAGVYSASVRIAEAFYYFPMAAVTVISPVLTAAHGASADDYNRLLLKSLRWLAWVMIGNAVVLSILARPLIRLLFGPDFEAAAPILAMHSWSGVFVALGAGAGPWFVNAGLQKLQMVQSVAGLAANVGLNALVIPRFGAFGAAAVTVASGCVSTLLVNALYASTRPLFFMQVRALMWRR